MNPRMGSRCDFSKLLMPTLPRSCFSPIWQASDPWSEASDFQCPDPWPPAQRACVSEQAADSVVEQRIILYSLSATVQSECSRAHNIPCKVKSNRFGGKGFGGLPGFLESGRRVFGSLNSSKKGWIMASMAERRCVGVYSRSREIKSMAFESAFLKTCRSRLAPD